MTLQGSGQISISNINVEKGLTSTTANSSLLTLSTTNINSASTYRPDTLQPHSMSEFHGYNHSASSASCYVVWNSSTNSTASVIWTDTGNTVREQSLAADTTIYLCSKTEPYESFPNALIVTPCGSSCTNSHTSISAAQSSPCPC